MTLKTTIKKNSSKILSFSLGSKNMSYKVTNTGDGNVEVEEYVEEKPAEACYIDLQTGQKECS